MAKRAYPSAKSKILEAAEAVIRRDGVRKLSVDAVVAEAGISKGGFFYHFKTKEELLRELVRALSAEAMADIAGLMARDPEPRGRALRSHIRAAFEYDVDPARRDRMIALTLALLTIAVESPEVMEEVRRGNDEGLRAFVGDGLPLAQVLLLNFAMEGFWLARSLGSTSVPEDWQRRFRDLLIGLTRVDVEALVRDGPPGRRD